MLTPAFKLTQCDDFVILEIKAPYIKTNDVQMEFEEWHFKFFAKPYFLRLTFPCEVIENGKEKAKYDISEGIFTIDIPKKNPGEHFPDLDMLSLLLAAKKDLSITKNLVENYGADNAVGDVDDEYDDNLWEVEQSLEKFSDEVSLNGGGFKYGFASAYSGIFKKLQNELFEVIDLTNPEETSPEERTKQRIAKENHQFSKEHYLADLFDDDHIQSMLQYAAPWEKEYYKITELLKDEVCSNSQETDSSSQLIEMVSEKALLELSEEEKSTLVQIPNKDYLLSNNMKQQLFFSLVDILFAYAYNHRTTEGENTSESAWTICKLSATLSWLEVFPDLSSVTTACMRRALCYPLYRHWGLVLKVFDDVIKILSLGKRWILRYLLELRDILNRDENKYILTHIYMNDFCTWIQKVSAKNICSLANKLTSIKLNKDETGLYLKQIEEAVINDTLNSRRRSSSEDTESSETESTTSLDSDDVLTDECEKSTSPEDTSIKTLVDNIENVLNIQKDTDSNRTIENPFSNETIMTNNFATEK